MTATRIGGTPIAHVTAEITAFPLAHVSALRLAIRALDPSLTDKRLGGRLKVLRPTRELWRAAEGDIVRCFPAFSVDETVAIRDRVWFAGESDRPVPLHHYLRRVAAESLEVQGKLAVPKMYSEQERLPSASLRSWEALARWRWRWLAWSLPADLLLAALSRSEANLPTKVNVLSPTLWSHLYDQGFAETHLHLGAGLDFPLLWISALNGIAQSFIKRDVFSGPGAELNEGVDLASWLIRAATVRYVLAAYLVRPRGTASFSEFVVTVFRDRALRVLGAANYSLLLKGFSEMLRGDIGESSDAEFATWKALYVQLTGVTPQRFPETMAEALMADPIASLMPADRATHLTSEMRFVAKALSHLESRQPDVVFEALFWQVVRVRNLLYRHVTQRPMTPGLTWFVRFYNRMWPARHVVRSPLHLASAATVCGQGLNIQSLEVRISPDASRTGVVDRLRQLDTAAETLRSSGTMLEDQYLAAVHNQLAPRSEVAPGTAANERAHPALPKSTGNDRGAATTVGNRGWNSRRRVPEFGVVYHFIKDRGGGSAEGVPQANWLGTNADPGYHGRFSYYPNVTGYRYARYYGEKEREALALIWTLKNLPMTIEVIRGLDVCTDELGVPFWVLAPLLRGVRRAGQTASDVLQRVSGGNVPALQTTVHAGEDFVHLLTGLRKVDEAVHLFELREGDRIGHAISLGVDPEDWARRSGRLAINREFRLFDLAWEWMWYRRSGTPIPRGRRNLLEHEIARLSETIFGERCNHHDIVQLVEDLNNGRKLWEMGFPHGPLPARDESEQLRTRLLRAYLTNGEVFRRSYEIEWVEPHLEGEVEALAAVQAGIRANIAARGITIEVNPSSNLLIGDLGDLSRHPLWRLQPPQTNLDVPPVSICIGSDDPLTFNTNLPNEYQMVSDALVLAGVSSEEARRWLDNARARGLEARFTLPVRSDRDLAWLRVPTLTEPSLLLRS